MEYRLLGSFEARVCDQPLDLGGPKQRALLALLVLNANRTVARDRLIEDLWSGSPPPTAVKVVQVYVSRLRKLLPPESLLTHASGYLLKAEPDAIDLVRFERLMLEAKGLDAEEASESLRRALDLWRGPALAEFVDEPFAQVEAGRLEDLRLVAVEERIEADLAIGRHAELVGELEGLIAEHPYRERLRAQLMLALYRCDRQAEALAAYRETRVMLDELGVEPSRRLRELERAVLTQDPALDPKLGRATAMRTNLPRPASSFVGREHEVAELISLIRGRARLVTVTGPGGSGKTRLAIEAAAALIGGFGGSVCWVGLGTIREPALVSETIARTLAAEEDLAAWIGTRELLLVLDNFEQVIDAGSEVAGLIEACPRLHVLVTSRERLRVRGEIEYPALPLTSAEAVELFTARASIDPDDIVVELCRRLDDLPLALELAAARTAVLSPRQILDRLSHRLDLFKGGRDADPRQQTLRAAIEWSFDLLDDAEARLFARLAGFRGGATLEAAEAVVEANLDTLQSLVDKNLVRHRGDRFWMHETIRAYAREQLVAFNEEALVADRHVNYFLELADQADAGHHRGETIASIAQLKPETDNFRQALEHCHDVGAADLELRLTAKLWHFWQTQGQVSEGRRWLERALASAPVDEFAEVRAEALVGAAELARIQGDHDEAQARATEARDLAAAAGNLHLKGAALNGLASLAIGRNELDEAANLLDEALDAWRADGEQNALTVATNNRAYLAMMLGDYAHGVALSDHAFALAREIGSDEPQAVALLNIGFGSLALGDRGRARAAFRDNAELSRRLGHAVWIAYTAEGLAALNVTADATHALSLLAAAAALRASIGVHLDPVEQQCHDATLDALREEVSTEAIDVAFREARSLKLEQILALMRTGVG